MTKALYTATATATGGRQGVAETADRSMKLTLARPVEMGGNGAGTNPEQLFACGYAACFASTIDHLARQERLETGPVSVTAHISLVKLDGEGYGIAAALEVALPTLPRTQAEAIVERARRNCPYSNATRGNVDTRVSVTAGG